MGSPVDTVMSSLNRGCRLLRESLNDYAIERGFLAAPPDDNEATMTGSDDSDGSDAR